MAARKPSVDLSQLPPPVECAHIGCKYPAIVRIKNSNLCHQHYIALANVVAVNHAAKNGLKSTSDHRAYIRKKIATFGNPRRNWREHWQKMLDDPKSNYTQKQFAEAALKNLGHGEKERIPGEDDEPALGIPVDALEVEFGRAA